VTVQRIIINCVFRGEEGRSCNYEWFDSQSTLITGKYI